MGCELPAKVVKFNMSKFLIVLAAFLVPIAVAAGVAGGMMLESPRTLAVALGAAWALAALIGYGFYGGKRTLEAATLLLAVALVVIVAYARPWAGGGAEENAVFLYNASFTYENSVDNLPIENVIISFPCPNIDNYPVLITDFSWSLFGSNPENLDEKLLQIQDGGVIQLLDGRTATLFIQYGRENTRHGPKISLSMDKLYPREIISIQAFGSVTPENFSNLTMYENKENLLIYAYSQYSPLDKKISMSFWAKLSIKIENNFENVEELSRTEENGESGYWWKLY